MDRYWTVVFVFDFCSVSCTVTSQEEDHDYIIKAAETLIFDTENIDVSNSNDVFVEETS